MPLRRFDIGLSCPGFPDDDQMKFRDERCCIVVLVEHLLKSIQVDTGGIRKVFITLESRNSNGLVDHGDFQAIAHASWPFEAQRYFAAVGDERSRLLAVASENALLALAQKRKWPKSAIREVFTEVRAANYILVADRAKACRLPDGQKRARVSYFVDRQEFRIEVQICGPKRDVLFDQTVYRDRPTAALCVHFALGKPRWTSNRALVLPNSDPDVPGSKIVVRIP